MRKKIVAGNWKMNKSQTEAHALLIALIKDAGNWRLSEEKEVVVIPPSIYLENAVAKVLSIQNVKIGAQNCSEYENGAYTGEISAEMLASLGVKYVVIGHSERRQYFEETNAKLYDKVVLAVKNGIVPIYCCGESLKIREQGTEKDFVKKQLEEGLFKLDPEEFEDTIIAYEPIWAIGTGLTATPAQAQEMHQYIRDLIKGKYRASVAENYTILYGGSCNATNADTLFACPDVDGGLIGGASLIAKDFITIIKAL